jgi:hypothetical protein
MLNPTAYYRLVSVQASYPRNRSETQIPLIGGVFLPFAIAGLQETEQTNYSGVDGNPIIDADTSQCGARIRMNLKHPIEKTSRAPSGTDSINWLVTEPVPQCFAKESLHASFLQVTGYLILGPHGKCLPKFKMC